MPRPTDKPAILTPEEEKRLTDMCSGAAMNPAEMFSAVTRMLAAVNRDDREYLKLRLRLKH